MQLSSAESRVLAAIDEQELVDTLVDLVRVPSVTGTDAESDLQHVLGAKLEQAGLLVDSWRLDLEELARDERYPGTEAPRSEGYGVVGSSGDGVPALVLQGHVDVVPVGDLHKWADADPYSARIDAQNALHGRGACDMKAGVAANLQVALALSRSGVKLERPFAVHSVVGEEDGGLGAFATLVRGHGGDAAVITEPTSARLVVANAGALTFELRVAGRAAHGSSRLEGHSAFAAFLPVHRALEVLESERNSSVDPLFDGHPLPYAISIGRVTAGDWSSSVPDLLVAEGRYGVRLDEDPARARADFEQAVAQVCLADPWLRDHPVEILWSGGQFGSGRIADGDPLIGDTARAVADVTGSAPAPIAAPYGSDLRLYNGVGSIPTLHYGPGDVRLAHAPRESVPIDEMITTARAMALLAVRRCGAH